MSKDLSITNDNDIEITSQTSLLRKTIASIALYSYVLSFVISPVYASTAEVIPSAPSTFHRHYYEGDVDDIEEDFKDVSVLSEAPLQQQFRLWSSLPPLMHKALRFDEVYQPAGWSSHYQVSLGFEDTHSQGVLNIPSSKDFVNLAGAQWLQNVYGPLGWHCHLEADESALAFSYRPGGRDETIAFSLNQRGHVRLNALNAKGGIFYTTGALSLAFTDDTVIPPQLIVAAPIIRNETELTADHLQLFTQEHINRGGYTLEQGEINAHYIENHQPINITKSFGISGHTWKNLADITGNGAIALHLQGTLDNRSKTIRSTDHLTLLAESINNENGTLEGKNFVLHLRRDLNNEHGKVLSEERVNFCAANFFSHTGLIRSLEGLDLRNVGHSDIGGIETHGDVFLKEGHFTLTPTSAMGNPDTKTQHKINRLVIEPKLGSPSLVMELLGTIKARFFQAFKSTVLGKDVKVDDVEAELDAKLTFAPGQIKRLKTYLKDNPLSLDYIEDLEQLEWLLLSEADVLPYDINTAGKFIVSAAPAATIPLWPITRNARAFKGLELHLPTTNVVMGDAKGETYPEWIADTGPLRWYLNSLDQKSGKILAKAGGGIETQGRIKIGETNQARKAFTENKEYYIREKGPRSASLGAGGEFILQSYTSDIDFCFAYIDLEYFKFLANGNVAFLSSKMKTRGNGLLKGKHLLLKPDDKYTSSGYMQVVYLDNSGCYSNRHVNRLVKEISFVFVDGDLTLDISESIKPIASFGVASGKLHNVTIPRQAINPETITETRQVNGYNCCQAPSRGHCTHKGSIGSFLSGLMTSDQMIISGYKVILEGLMSAPVIEFRTNDFQSYIVGNRRPQLAATPATLHDLSHYVGFSPFHRANPNPLGPSIIHDFVRMAAPPSVYYHHGRFSSAPLPGARQRYDHPIIAQAMVEALVSQLKECYIQPHTSFSHNYLLANLNSVKALANIKRHYPELVDETHMLPALPGTEKSTFEIARKAERVTERFGDQPAILHVLEEDGQYTSYLHTPASSVHRSLKRSEALLLGREKILIAPLDASQPSSTYIAGAAVDSSDKGTTEINTDHTVIGPHQWKEEEQRSYKKGKKKITETITSNLTHSAYLGGSDVRLDGITQSFTGHLEATNSYLIHGSESAEIGVAHETREVIRHEQKKNSYGKKKNKQSHEYSSRVIPSVLQVHNPAGKGIISSGNTVHMISPHFAAVLTEIKARKAILEVGHNISGGSSVSTSTDPFVNRVKISSHHHDRAVAAKMDGKVLIDADEVTTQRPAGTTYPNLEIVPRAETTDQEIADIYQSYSDSQSSLGIVPIGALGLLGGLAGGQIFGAVFGTTAGATTGVAAAGTATTTAANLTAAQIISASTLAMAKAATCFMGSHLFQGLATGNFKVDVRGLGTTIAAAALIGSGPDLDAKATFMENLASQVVHELKAAPTRMAINTTIGGERFEDAAVSTLRQGASHAIGATLAHQIGQFYQGPDKLGYITHKLAHFASGALGGTIAANDPLGGGFGAAFAEVAMEAMVDAKAEATAIKQENPGLKEDELREKLHNRLMAKRFFSQVIGGFVGTMAGKGNFSLAASTAAIALDYNMMPTLLDEACREYYGLTPEKAMDDFLNVYEDSKSSDTKEVLQKNPELAKALLIQREAKEKLQLAALLEKQDPTLSLSREGLVESLDIQAIGSTRQEAISNLRHQAYQMIASANDSLNTFAREHPELTHYTVKVMAFGATALHTAAYVSAATYGGPAGIATLVTVEQAIGASLEAAIEFGAEHAAASARTPEEATRLREAFVDMAGKGLLVAAVVGVGKTVKGGVGKSSQIRKKSLYTPQEKTGSSFSQFDAKASAITKETTSLQINRELHPNDLGLKGHIEELRGNFSINDKQAKVRIDYIEARGSNVKEAIDNLSRLAKSHGAETLTIQGTFANDKFYRVLPRWYKITTEGANDSIVIKLD
jgi:hypothetical protein